MTGIPPSPSSHQPTSPGVRFRSNTTSLIPTSATLITDLPSLKKSSPPKNSPIHIPQTISTLQKTPPTSPRETIEKVGQTLERRGSASRFQKTLKSHPSSEKVNAQSTLNPETMLQQLNKKTDALIQAQINHDKATSELKALQKKLSKKLKEVNVIDDDIIKLNEQTEEMLTQIANYYLSSGIFLETPKEQSNNNEKLIYAKFLELLQTNIDECPERIADLIQKCKAPYPIIKAALFQLSKPGQDKLVKAMLKQIIESEAAPSFREDGIGNSFIRDYQIMLLKPQLMRPIKNDLESNFLPKKSSNIEKEKSKSESAQQRMKSEIDLQRIKSAIKLLKELLNELRILTSKEQVESFYSFMLHSLKEKFPEAKKAEQIMMSQFVLRVIGQCRTYPELVDSSNTPLSLDLQAHVGLLMKPLLAAFKEDLFSDSNKSVEDNTELGKLLTGLGKLNLVEDNTELGKIMIEIRKLNTELRTLLVQIGEELVKKQ